MAKGVNACPEFNSINIKITEGSTSANQCFKFSKIPSGELSLEILKVSKSDCIIPKENDLLDELIRIAILDIPPTIEDKIYRILCVPNIEGTNQPVYLSPLITETGTFIKQFTLFHPDPYVPANIEAEGLMPHISGCLISLYSHMPAADIKVSNEMGKLIVQFYVSKLEGPMKLMLRIANKILYTKVLMCYDPDKIPRVLKEVKKNEMIFFGTHDAGDMGKKGKVIKTVGWRNSPLETNDGKYILYVFLIMNNKI